MCLIHALVMLVDQLEVLVGRKADASDLDRRALKAEVDNSLRTQMNDIFAIIQTKSEAGETKVRPQK